MKTSGQTELVVYDAVEPCPYLPERMARMPLRWPTRRLSGWQFDQRLAEGDRRYGAFLYRTRCPRCVACEPIRIPVADFEPDARQRRILRRNDGSLSLSIGPPHVDSVRVELFNRHRRMRGLCGRDADLDASAYREFLVESCCETLEISYQLEGRPVAIAITDRGQEGVSAVYTYFDPSCSRLSLGTYSILKQVELCRQWNCRYLYLGLYIADSPKMAYKAGYLPHERLIDGRWQSFVQQASSRGGRQAEDG